VAHYLCREDKLIKRGKKMNLHDLYGPTMNLKELCKVFKINPCTFYSYINPKKPSYKVGFPKPLAGYRKNLFRTKDIELYFENTCC